MKYSFLSLKEFEFTLIEYKKKLHCPVFPSYNLTKLHNFNFYLH